MRQTYIIELLLFVLLMASGSVLSGAATPDASRNPAGAKPVLGGIR